jgi:tetratricopeptide (TPR) repeat protein
VSALLAMAEAANDDGWRAEAYQRQAEYVLRVHDYPLLIRVAEQAIAAARRSGLHTLEARGLASKGVALGRIGQTQAARQSFEEALARVHESGDAASISIVGHWATEHFASSGEWERAAQVSIEAVNMARSAADRHLEATALGGLGRAYIQLGLYDAAMETSQSAMKLHEMLGNRFQYAYAVLFLGMVHFRLGESAAAKAMLERQETEVVASEPFWHAVCSFILALIAEQMGDWETAAQRTRRARDLYSQIGAKARATQCEGLFARIALAEGRLDEAESAASRIWAYVQTYGTAGMGLPFLACLICAEVFQAVGDTDKSQAVLDFGQRTLMAQADQINNPQWRKSFLENIPEHGILIQRWHDLHAKRGVTEG